jgi:outer membrane receptor protein involved in Fe transport
MRSFLVSLLFSFLTLAQSEIGTASLGGVVRDPSGASIAGAKISVRNLETGLARSLESTDAGAFTFVRLPLGPYELGVEKQGFKAWKRKDVVLGIGASLSLEIGLEIGATTETVNVSSDLPVVETTRSSTATSVNEKAVRDLPINGRNFLDFTVLTPGVVRDPRGGDLSFGGQRGTANSVLVDGGDSNNLFFGQSSGRAGGGRNPYTFSQDAVQEFQVNTSGYAPEIGRAGGGVINMVTKSGTNDIHGTAFWFFRDRGMNANKWENNRAGRPKGAYHFNQFGGNIGGPVKKDKLFYFFNYDGQRNSLPVVPFFPIAIPNDPVSQAAARELSAFQTPYAQGQINNIFTGKVDYLLSGTQTLSIRYNAHRFEGNNFENGGPQSALERTGNSNITSDNIAVNYTKIIGATTVLDSRVIFLRDNQPGFANSDRPEAQIRQSGQAMISIGRNNFSPRFTNSRKVNLINAISHSRGAHTYKFGADMNFERITNFFPGNFGGSYTFDSLIDWANRRPSAYTQGFAGAGTSGPTTYPHANEFGFFAQDQWRVNNRLTLNYGARYDLMAYAQNNVQNPNTMLLGMGLDTSRINRDTNNLAGRLGFAYNVGASGRMVLRGGYGTFYGRTPSILTGTAHSQNGIQVQTYTLRANVAAQAPLLPVYPNVLSGPPTLARTPDIYVVAPDYVQPLSHQWNLNIERQLSNDFSVTFGYLGVRGIHLTRTRDINLFPSQNVAGVLAGGGTINYMAHPTARPNTAFGRISLFESGASSAYHGGFIQAQKRYARNFQLQSSYTWSKVIDTVPDATSVVVGTGDDAKVAQDTLLPNLDRGRGDADISHRMVASGVWDLNYYRGQNAFLRHTLGGWQLSLITQLQSGRVANALVSADINADGNSRNDRAPGFGRNTLEGPGFASWDFRVSRDITFFERMKLRLMGEAFNSFNRPNFTTFDQAPFAFTAATRTFSPRTQFLTNTGTADARILQLAARITF